MLGDWCFLLSIKEGHTKSAFGAFGSSRNPHSYSSMKYLSSQVIRNIATLALGATLITAMSGGEIRTPCDSILVDQGDEETDCLIVFAKVGESFHFAAESEPAHPGTESINWLASGELPVGLDFDPRDSVLSGVPMKPGFHELVLESTDEQSAPKQVILIDIQPLSLGSGGMNYASYFSQGIH